jgi:hypothetical protein
MGSFVRYRRSFVQSIMSDQTANRDMCAYPGCTRPTAPPPPTGGRSRYCDDPEHHPVSAYRLRRRLEVTRVPAPRRPAAPADSGRSTKTGWQLGALQDRLQRDLARLERSLAETRQAFRVATDSTTLTRELQLAEQRLEVAVAATRRAEARAAALERERAEAVAAAEEATAATRRAEEARDAAEAARRQAAEEADAARARADGLEAARQQLGEAEDRVERSRRERDAAYAEVAVAKKRAADAEQTAREVARQLTEMDRAYKETTDQAAGALARARAAETRAELLAQRAASAELRAEQAEIERRAAEQRSRSAEATRRAVEWQAAEQQARADHLEAALREVGRRFGLDQSSQ